MVKPENKEVITTDSEMNENSDQDYFVRERSICSCPMKHYHFEALLFTLIKGLYGEKDT